MDSTSVYWTNRGTSANELADGAVMKVPIGGGILTTLASHGGTPVKLASTSGPTQSIVVDITSMYWCTQDGKVMKMPLGGGTPITLASEQGDIFGLTVDDANVYWTAGDKIMKVPLDGGTPITVASGQAGPMSVAVDDTSVYWTNQGTSDGTHWSNGSVMKLTPK